MAYPNDYQRKYGFENFQDVHPNNPLPGDQVDVELDAIGASTDAIIAFISKVMRSDGALANGIVGVDALAADLSIGFKEPHPWTASTMYLADDTVFYLNVFYSALVGHTSSSTFDATKWEILVDFNAISGDAGTSAAAAAASAIAAAASASLAAAGRANVSTTAALLSLYPSAFVLPSDTVLYTGGRDTPGDGGHGTFRYDASDTTSSDNGGTLRVDGQGRRFKYVGNFVSVKVFGAKADGSTDDTTAVQAWFNSQATEGRVGTMPATKCNIGVVTMHGSSRIQGCYGAGFNLVGLNAGVARDANITGVWWSDIAFIGDGNVTHNQYALVGSSSFTLTDFRFNNMSASNVTNGRDLSNASNGVIVGGTIGPTLGDGSQPGVGYGDVVGSNTFGGQIRILGVRYYRCMRHSLYALPGADIVATGCIFMQHRFGQTASNYAALAYSRGSNAAAIGCLWDSCADSPWSCDNDTTFSAAATNFTIASPTVKNCLAAAFVGAAVTIPDDTESNHTVSITDVNWSAPTTNVGQAIVVFGANVCKITGQFDFTFPGGGSAPNNNVSIVYVPGTQGTGPFALDIDISARTVTTNSINCLVELGSSVCASGSNAEVNIAGRIWSPSGTAPSIFHEDAEIQNTKIRCSGNSATKAITGATPWTPPAYRNFSISQSVDTNVTALQGVVDGQTLEIVTVDGHSTFVNASTLKMAGGANKKFAANAIVALKGAQTTVMEAWRTEH